ncbi:unnamed protein product [Lasius platythorax]|uniref:Uncharacterized protein n=2 Tax=Lasius TaxID=488720 RepID=A0A0J7N8S2_LASNI|nr:hypothetical protein RF55_11353 [Lasius niger]
MKPEASANLTSGPSSSTEARVMEEMPLTQRTVPTTKEPEEDPDKPETGEMAEQQDGQLTQSVEERATEPREETVPLSSQEASQ